MKRKNNIAILIPCFNEGLTIRKVIKDFKKALPEATVYVYDNNSTDNTVEEALVAGAIVRHEYKQGKGNVIRRMFREVQADCYVMVDGDDTYSVEHAPLMVQKILNEQVDMVIGDRLSSTYFVENKRPFHNFGNTIVRNSINCIFHTEIKDVMTGYRALSYNFVKTFPVLSKGFEIETEMTIHAVDKNMSIDHVIIDYKDRPQGSTSKLNTYTDGIKVLFMIFNLCRIYKPLLFFGILSSILVILSTILFIPILGDFYKTGVVEKIPTLIGCGFMYLSAVLSIFTGFVLSSIQNLSKKDFEWRLIQNERNEL